jgi:hypothetical protein
VQLPSWKPADLVEVISGFEGEQKLAQFVGTPLALPSS